MFIQSTKGASSERLKILIMGPSGVGKTFLASTIGEPTLVISAEAGHLTLNEFDLDMIDLSTEKDKDGKIVYLDEAGRYQKLLRLFEWLQTDEPRKKYKWIYFDSITEVGGIVIRMLEKDSKYSAAKMTMPRYGEYTKKMIALILSYRDIPFYNIAFTGLVENKGDDGAKAPATILLPGTKLPENLPAFFDEVFYYGIKRDGNEDKRYLLTTATAEAYAKDRSGKLSKFEKPNLADIAKKIRGEKNVSK